MSSFFKQNKKNVLILTTTFPRWKDDTTPTFVYELSKRLKAEKLELIILAPHHREAKNFEVLDDLKVYRFPYFYPMRYQRLAYGGGILPNIKSSNLAKIQVPFLFLSELFWTFKIIREKNIDGVHSHWMIPSGLIGAFCRRAFGIPHIATLHGSDVNTIKKSRILRKICSFIVHNSDRITTNSNFIKNVVLSIDDKAQDKVEIIPMGVDIESFKSKEDVNLKAFFGVKYLILSVGRLIDWKGISYLIMAMKKVITKFPNTKLLIGGSGPERENLENLVVKLDLKKTIIFIGYIKNIDLPKYYRSADVFCLPSINLNGQTEALGVVLLEAMACGIPVVGSNVGGIPDIIKDGYNGFLVPEKSPEDLANRIIELLSNDKIAKEFIVNGLNTVRDKFSWGIVTGRFCNVYKQLLE